MEKSRPLSTMRRSRLTVLYKAKNVTTVSIRVGLLGDKLASQLIHDKIGDNLLRK